MKYAFDKKLSWVIACKQGDILETPSERLLSFVQSLRSGNVKKGQWFNEPLFYNEIR
jgi:hypothetical protein